MREQQGTTFRNFVYQQLDPRGYPKPGLSFTNVLLAIFIVAAAIIAILETEPILRNSYATLFRNTQYFFIVVFVAEYFTRFWAAAERGGWTGRFEFVRSPAAIVDLLVIAASLTPFFTGNIALLRLVRLFRIMRLAKLGRISEALQSMGEALRSRRFELGLTIALAGGLMLFGASALYWIEGELQPDKFGSIPRALWWAVITLTTIGYGDFYPVTVAGKVVASLVAFSGIGLIAMPTGILAAAFSDALEQKRNERTKGDQTTR